MHTLYCFAMMIEWKRTYGKVLPVATEKYPFEQRQRERHKKVETKKKRQMGKRGSLQADDENNSIFFTTHEGKRAT